MSNAAKPRFRNYKAPVKLQQIGCIECEACDNEGPLVRAMKGWGREDWLLNDKGGNLCVKILTLNFKKSCSFHFHRNKAEIFFVIRGQIYFEYKDTESGETLHQELLAGDSVYIPPGCPHRFSGSDPDGSVFLEASTFHEDSDSYRIFPGDSQRA